MIDIELVKKAYEKYKSIKDHFNKINQYYYGNTDSLADFEPMPGRSNLKAKTNFIQKLVDEEAGYSFGNKFSYISKDDNKEVAEDIEYSLNNNEEDHDSNLGIELVKNGCCYEINYIDDNNNFKNRIVSPLDGYMYKYNGNPLFFIHVHAEEDEKIYIDVYDKEGIYFYNDSFEEVSPSKKHYFSIVPVGYGYIGGKEYSTKRGYVEGDKTIYRTIKTLQDAFETNLSDIVNEISDFRNAILKLYGITVDKDENGKEKKPVIRDNTVMLFGDKTKQDADWLIKNINDTFIKNTRDDIKDLIYTLTSHIDNNEKMQSNLSGIALRSRLQMLENKCTLNEKAMANILKTRLKCLFKYLFIKYEKEYDVNLVNVRFTPNIPVDVTSNADLVSKVPHEVISNKTKRTLFPFITNPESEQNQIDIESKNQLPQVDLNNFTHE